MPGERLTIAALSSRERVLEAIKEYDRLGPHQFRSLHGYRRARRYRLRYKSRTYDAKAIAGVAWGLQHFNDPRQRPASYTGGAHTSVPALERLGFTIVNADTDSPIESEKPPELEPGRTYSWEELGEVFDFPPNYLSRAGGMVPRPDHDSLLLITHDQEGQGFSYGDEWDGPDLIYAGRGRTGHQELKGANRYVAENSRHLYLFEAAGSRQLYFHGRVRCADHWESTGYDVVGNERRLHQFRLAPLGRRKRRTRRKIISSERSDQGRSPESFVPRPFDPNRRPSQRRRSAPRDPESQKVLAEQADQAHQNALSTVGLWLQSAGWVELQEIDGAIDLLAKSPRPRNTVLFEIKSITDGSERTRVRSGLAQLLEYRLFLGSPRNRLCLVSNRPISERRLRLLDSLEIAHLYVEGDTVQVSGTKSSRALFPR